MVVLIESCITQGPRQDGGSLFDNDNPGVQLAERIYNYCAKYHPKTKVMVAGFRNKAGVHASVITAKLLQIHFLDHNAILEIG